MKIFQKLYKFLLICCFFPFVGNGAVCVDPCAISLEFDFLMTKPFIQNTNFVCSNQQETLGPSPVGHDTQNVPGYRPQYRGEIAYSFCPGNRLALIGSYYKTSSVTKVDADPLAANAFLLPTQGIGTYLNALGARLYSAMSDIDLQFYNIELLYQKDIYRRPCFLLSLIGGVQFANVQYQEEVAYNQFGLATIIRNRFRNLSHFAGVGPEAGVDCNVFFLPHRLGRLALHASLSGSLLASYTKARHNGEYRAGLLTPADLFPDLRRNTWTFNPVWCGGVGLNYTLTCWRWIPTVEIGVKCANYYHAITKFFFMTFDAFGTIASPFVNEAEYSNLGFFSPYVSIKVSF